MEWSLGPSPGRYEEEGGGVAGEPIAAGVLHLPDGGRGVPPQATVSIPLEVGQGEAVLASLAHVAAAYLEVRFTLKDEVTSAAAGNDDDDGGGGGGDGCEFPWAQPGHEIAHYQLPFDVTDATGCSIVGSALDPPPPAAIGAALATGISASSGELGELALGQIRAALLDEQPLLVDATPQALRVATDSADSANPDVELVFSRVDGCLKSFVVDGEPLLTTDGMRPNFWRAPTDNDRGGVEDMWVKIFPWIPQSLAGAFRGKTPPQGLYSYSYRWFRAGLHTPCFTDVSVEATEMPTAGNSVVEVTSRSTVRASPRSRALMKLATSYRIYGEFAVASSRRVGKAGAPRDEWR